ncbi:MAG TPA: hypothetical protein PKC21_00035 [Oligoflexia bacterium]|nr:hypothetical protein [Oligoflexia bacterium]
MVYLYILLTFLCVAPETQANEKKLAHVGIFVNTKTFDGKDQNQLDEYNNLIQRLSIHSDTFTLKTFPIRNISNDALILAKAAIDQVQTVVILRKISPNYIAVSLWDVQNYSLIAESAFENMGNRKLINDFSDWFNEQNQKLYRSGPVDAEIFALQLIEQKRCNLLRKFIEKTQLDDSKQAELIKNCDLRESFNQLLSGKKKESNSKVSGPAQIKISTKPYAEDLTLQWVDLFKNSTMQQNLGKYDVSNLSLIVNCKTDLCLQLNLKVDIVSYSHIDFRTQYRLSSYVLDLISQGREKFPKKDFTAGAEVTFYHEYSPINTFLVSGTLDAPNIITKNTPK